MEKKREKEELISLHKVNTFIFYLHLMFVSYKDM